MQQKINLVTKAAKGCGQQRAADWDLASEDVEMLWQKKRENLIFLSFLYK